MCRGVCPPVAAPVWAHPGPARGHPAVPPGLPLCLPCRAQGAASPCGGRKGRGPRSGDCPGVTWVLPSGKDSPTASTLSSRQYLVWLVVASRTRRWSWVKSLTSWPGKTQTCHVLPAPWRHVETVHTVGTSLRNGEQGPAAPHASCPGPVWRRGDLGQGTETSVSPAPSLCPYPLQGTIPTGLRDSHGPSPAAGCVVAAM